MKRILQILALAAVLALFYFPVKVTTTSDVLTHQTWSSKIPSEDADSNFEVVHIKNGKDVGTLLSADLKSIKNGVVLKVTKRLSR